MSLIVALRSSQGIVICADSQETVDDDFWVKVDKLKPVDVGHYQLAFAGSGGVAGLIERFGVRIYREVENWSAGMSHVEIEEKIRELLVVFNKEEVRPLRAKKNEKILDFIICLRDKASGSGFLYKTHQTLVESVRDHALVGFYPVLFEGELQRLYRTGASLAYNRMLGVHVLSIAKQLVKWVGGPTKVVFATDKVMRISDQKEVEIVEKYVEALQYVWVGFTLSLADTTMNDDGFLLLLETLANEVGQLRDYYTYHANIHTLYRMMSDPGFTGEPFISVPRETFIEFTRNSVGIRLTSPPPHTDGAPRVSFPFPRVEPLAPEQMKALLKAIKESEAANAKARGKQKKSRKSQKSKGGQVPQE